MVSNCFYYGVYSPQGFYNLARKPNFSARRNFLIKCCSEMFKQELFDSLKAELNRRGQSYIDLRADDRSIGVYSQDAGFRITDATYDTEPVKSDETVFELDTETKSAEVKDLLIGRNQASERATRFLSACQCINNDMIRLDKRNIDFAKLNRYTSRLWISSGGRLKGSIGTEHKRFITCITPGGVELNPEAFEMYCDNIVLICDRVGACAGCIVDRMRRYSLSSGYDVISCLCPMNINSGAEHLIVPELKLGVFTCKHFHRAYFEKGRRIFAVRFMSDSETSTKRRMDFSFKAYRRLMKEVFVSLESVREYDEALDFLLFNGDSADRIREITQEILDSR